MIPADLRYHTEHEWIRVDGQRATLGITHYAQDSMGDIVYLDPPEVGAQVRSGDEIGEVESTKTTSPIYTPVSGKIVAINEELKEKPELINKEPYGRGWIALIELSTPSEIQDLMDARQYEAYIQEEAK